MPTTRVRITTKLFITGAVSLLPLVMTAQQTASQQESLEQVYKAAKALTSQDIPQLQKAAESGDIRQQMLLGTAYRQGDGVAVDYTKALYWLRKAADSKLAAAQVQIGLLYTEGKGVPRDDAEAMRWFRMAADQNSSDAAAFIGSMYEAGQGVPADFAEAVKWYRLGADEGGYVAQRFLGDMYAQGKGVPKDNVEAAKWYRKAAAQGDQGAQKRLNALQTAASAGNQRGANPVPNALQESPLSREVGPGETSPGLYKNDYLGLSFRFPREWKVANRRALDSIQGRQAASARAQFGTPSPNVTMEALPSALLFAAQISGTGVFTIWVEKNPFIQRADQYFPNKPFLYDKSAAGTRGPEKYQVDGTPFYRADRWATFPDRSVYQIRLVTAQRNMILGIDITSSGEAAAQTLLQALTGLRIVPAKSEDGANNPK